MEMMCRTAVPPTYTRVVTGLTLDLGGTTGLAGVGYARPSCCLGVLRVIHGGYSRMRFGTKKCRNLF
jgi:hypothetical protein